MGGSDCLACYINILSTMIYFPFDEKAIMFVAYIENIQIISRNSVTALNH